jgi:hypothetical protein
MASRNDSVERQLPVALETRNQRTARAGWWRLLSEREGEGCLTPQAWDAVVEAAAAHHPVTAEQDSTTIGLWNWSAEGIVAWRIGGWILCSLAGDGAVMVVAGAGASFTPRIAERLVEVCATREVRFLTTTTARQLAPLAASAGFVLEPRRGDADYVVSMERLAQLGTPGSGFHGKAVRRLERRFALAQSPERAIVRERSLADRAALDELLETCAVWRAAKERRGKVLADDATLELGRLAQWPVGVDASQVRIFSLRLDGEPAAAAAVRQMRDRTLMGVSFKASPDEPGAAEFLRRAVAQRAVAEFGPSAVWNIQQDAGLPQLRRAKLSYSPVRIEPKFAVVPVDRTRRVPHDADGVV